jgi:hypothetical protein
MFSLSELAQKIDAYNDRKIELVEFEEWFRRNSWGFYDREGESLSDAIAAVDMALTSFELNEIGENELRLELAAANRPFASDEVLLVVSAPVSGTSNVAYDYPQELLGTRGAPIAALAIAALVMLAVHEPDRRPLSSCPSVEFHVAGYSV